MTEEQIEEARAMVASGKTYKETAQYFGFKAGSSIAFRIDPERAEKKRRSSKIYREAQKKRKERLAKMTARPDMKAHLPMSQRVSKMQSPKSLTAALMGDPLPGRSALDQRGGRV